MVFIARQESFVCEHCGKTVEPLAHGSYRNHCPYCLYSKHVDRDGPGDRSSTCGGIMSPIGLDQRSGKGFVLIHRCTLCGKKIANICASDDDLANFHVQEM